MRQSIFRGYSKPWTLSALQSRGSAFCYGPTGLPGVCVGVYGPESGKQVETRIPIRDNPAADVTAVWHESEVREVAAAGNASHLYQPVW